ncbi:Glutathione-regulated potassium-efflux system protein KefC, partial [Haemophilus influenzae]
YLLLSDLNHVNFYFKVINE